ncbi:ParB/RepB/Spo0J family partition protein [Sphingomicrobium lutaoense]|uniref:ParB family chromosome partitioning protein n=1 Tax=Sphingomicrobium lutaoense TaxID=515949 RepID=A0A839Z2K7_9SPHN|nr:ParB/RepB/Spo0J family partition protein [Sphingomicrobium lutaoense]MBB3764788.1 ParB family chromosome partitioning protein [Sphingomicrobium lutaoense]
MKKPSGLGRGLSALLDDASKSAANEERSEKGGVSSLPIASIKPNPQQPRRHFDEESLEELAQSIATKGVLQPILVRPTAEGYQIIAGERRWRAAQKAQLHEIPAIVRESDAQQTAEIALIENVQREDLNAIEEAEAYKALKNDYGYGQAEIGEVVGKSRSHVANLLRLLDLPQDVQKMLLSGDLSMGHARAALSAEDPSALAREIVKQGLSVREAEARAKSQKEPKNQSDSKKSARPVDADIEALERQLGDLLGLRVKVAHGKGGGRVELNYRTLDQLDMICQRLSGEPI